MPPVWPELGKVEFSLEMREAVALAELVTVAVGRRVTSEKGCKGAVTRLGQQWLRRYASGPSGAMTPMTNL